MRTDIFQDKKCIHIKLDKDVHVVMRTKLFERGLSMQELFNEFARLLAIDDSRAIKIVEQFEERKLNELLDRAPAPTHRKKTSEKRIDELDHDVLYNLISGDASPRTEKPR